MLKTDLAWLAGIIDGEGTISFNITPRPQIQVQITVVNTDRRIVTKAQRVLHQISVPATVNQRERYGERWKRPWVVSMSGFGNTRKVLKAVVPYLVGKLQQAQLMISFCERRLAYGYMTRAIRVKRGTTSYTREDMRTINKMRALNFRGRRQKGIVLPKLVGFQPTAWRADGMLFRNYNDALRRRNPVKQSTVLAN